MGNGGDGYINMTCNQKKPLASAVYFAFPDVMHDTY